MAATVFDWLCWTLGGAAVVAGVAAAYWALLHDRARGRKRCPRCWYDMGGSPTLVCPECGRDAGSERRLLRTRRRWWWGAVSAVLVVIGTTGAAWPRGSTRGWMSFVPAPVLYVWANVEWAPGSDAAESHVHYRSAASGEITSLGRYVLVSQALRTLERDADAVHRRDAASILGWIGARDSRVTPALVAALGDRHAVVRIQAVRMMGVYFADAGRAVPALMELLGRGASEPAEVRTEALHVLSTYRARAAGAAPLYITALDDPDPAVAGAAAAAMHRVGVDMAEQVPRLVRMLETFEPEQKGRVVLALRRCGAAGEEAVAALIRLLESSDEAWMETEIVGALGNIGPAAAESLPAIAAWAKRRPGWSKMYADASLGLIRGEYDSYIAALTAAMRDPDPLVRQEVATELRRLAHSERDRGEVLRLLRLALDDPDSGVVMRACGGVAPFGRDAESLLPRLDELRRRGQPMADYAIHAIERAETAAGVVEDWGGDKEEGR